MHIWGRQLLTESKQDQFISQRRIHCSRSFVKLYKFRDNWWTWGHSEQGVRIALRGLYWKKKYKQNLLLWGPSYEQFTLQNQLNSKCFLFWRHSKHKWLLDKTFLRESRKFQVRAEGTNGIQNRKLCHVWSCLNV